MDQDQGKCPCQPSNRHDLVHSLQPDNTTGKITVGDQGTVAVSAPVQLDLGLPLGTATASTVATTRIEKPLTTTFGVYIMKIHEMTRVPLP